MSDDLDTPSVPYHLLFVSFEFDRDYWGGDYDQVGETVLVPVALVDVLGAKKAFKHVTGLSPKHIISYSTDELCNAAGDDVTEWDDPFGRAL